MDGMKYIRRRVEGGGLGQRMRIRGAGQQFSASESLGGFAKMHSAGHQPQFPNSGVCI